MTGDQFKPIDKPYWKQWQKAEIRRCARLTNGSGYVPSDYKTGAYIVPAFVLDPDPEETS